MAKQSASVPKARGAGPSRGPRIAAVVTVVIVAVAVFGGIFLFGGSSTPAAPAAAIPPTRVDATYPTSVQNGVIVAGPAAGAPHTLDVYEDALCPACRQFETQAAQPITAALDAGRLQVRYHLVNLLEDRSRPAGYSTAAGNAIICAAENGAFPSVHASLYAAQPEENAAGYTIEQLVTLGQQVGAGAGYTACVQNGAHTAAVAQNFQQASTDPALQSPPGSFGTPTLVLDGRLQTSQDNQLAGVLGG
jgi:protein-disulfide isomerase